MSRAPSIRSRLLRTQLVWALLWGVALAAAVWLVARHEVNELLDASLQSAAEGLIAPLAGQLHAAGVVPAAPVEAADQGHFVWQLIDHAQGTRVLAAGRGAPVAALQAAPTPGFADLPGWRVFGLPLGPEGQMLYAAQQRSERTEAQLDLVLHVLLAAVPMVGLALLWLWMGLRRELQPLQALSERLAEFDPLQPGATLGEAEFEELRPVQAAIDALAARLARRVEHERAFTAHAAHALRTPLAGIDAQLAVALREAPAELQPRLLRVRAAASRLQRVVVALLALFRSGAEVQRAPIDLAALAARLPVEGLLLDVSARHAVHADADLVTAALLNLLDNALRHGARTVVLSTSAPNVLRVQDDGSGSANAERLALQQALDAQDYEGRMGLGLMLADLVARAHGGRLTLLEAAQGFVAELILGPAR